jgi:hypothetical protein
VEKVISNKQSSGEAEVQVAPRTLCNRSSWTPVLVPPLGTSCLLFIVFNLQVHRRGSRWLVFTRVHPMDIPLDQGFKITT